MADHGNRSFLKSEEDRVEDPHVFVYDRRKGQNPPKKIAIGGVFTYAEFLDLVRQHFDLSEKFVVSSTSREWIKDDMTYDQFLNPGDTLYILHSMDQELSAPAKEKIQYIPHFDTIVKSGMYEYYASGGINPLPYAVAELIDNALGATKDNKGSREIEVVIQLDEKTGYLAVIDNGSGMNTRELNAWAIYRFSKERRTEKFQKKLSTGHGSNGSNGVHTNGVNGVGGGVGGGTSMVNGKESPIPRSLNSEISFFGVGGKQAVFFIGEAVRMITKTNDSKDIHELRISKDEFERREAQHEAIYTDYIHNRKPGDGSHYAADEHYLHQLVKEETKKDHFTAVVCQGVHDYHIKDLKTSFRRLCTQLAHIYHYYIHGPDGNGLKEEAASSRAATPSLQDLTIRVRMQTKSKVIETVDLRSVDYDHQTKCIRTAASTFKFKAAVDGVGVCEGELRYHPFLFTRETFPPDTESSIHAPMDPDSDVEEINLDGRPARGKRPVFETYWNGRLIPYTCIDEFDWCSLPKRKHDSLPKECYNRVSGVLFSDSTFQVSTNKLTFMDLENKLKDKNATVFSCIDVAGGLAKRTVDIAKDFNAWLKTCHEKYDKQIKFMHFVEEIVRKEQPKGKTQPWSVFKRIQWDKITFKQGDWVHICRSNPNFYGQIKRFLLFAGNESKGDIFATGGEVELEQLPASLYGEEPPRTFPIQRLDKFCNDSQVQAYLEQEENKLPDKLIVEWPEGDELAHGSKRKYGQCVIGAIKCEILNRSNEAISKMPGTGVSKKLFVRLNIIKHGNSGDHVVTNHLASHASKWPYWFRRIDNPVKDMGSYSLELQVCLGDATCTSFNSKPFPCHKIKFTVTEGDPVRFNIGQLEGPFRIGSSFTIPLEFTDEKRHPTKPVKDLKPEISAEGLEISYEEVVYKSMSLQIRGIMAKGSVTSLTGTDFQLKISLPDGDLTSSFKNKSENLKIRIEPGLPKALQVLPEGDVKIENGSPLDFEVRVVDISGNVTKNVSKKEKLNVEMKFCGSQAGLPLPYKADISQLGKGPLKGSPINLKKLTKETEIKVRFEMASFKDLPSLERVITIFPSKKVNVIRVSRIVDDESTQPIKNGDVIKLVAGSTLSDLCFTLTDEAGRDVEITKTTLEKLKVTWQAKIESNKAYRGILPDIKVPSLVREGGKYCNISIGDVDLSFTIEPIHGPPKDIKVTTDAANLVVRRGEKMDEKIFLSLVDSFGNACTSLENYPQSEDQRLEIDGAQEAEVIYMEGLTFKVSNVVIHEADNAATPYYQQLGFKWGDMESSVKVEVVAGLPKGLVVKDWPLDVAKMIHNEDDIEKIVCQIVDAWDNPCPDNNINVRLTKSGDGVKLEPSPKPEKTKNGKASFGPFKVSGDGNFTLQPKASLNKSGTHQVVTFDGPQLHFSIQLDPNKPERLDVMWDADGEQPSFTVNDKLPEYSIRIFSEDGGIMKTGKKRDLHLYLWHVDVMDSKAKKLNIPPKDSDIYDASSVDTKSGTFRFSNLTCPIKVGEYRMMTEYNDGVHKITSSINVFHAIPGEPVKLVPNQPPGTPLVSNTQRSATRTILRNLRLSLEDKYGNTSGEFLKGTLVLTIIHNCDGTKPSPKELEQTPQFTGHSKSLSIPFELGQCHVQTVQIAENSPGLDERNYFLRCELFEDAGRRKKGDFEKVAPFDVQFVFYNDSSKQSAMQSLSKNRDELRRKVASFREFFSTSEEILNALRSTERTQRDKLNEIGNEIKQRHKVHPKDLQRAANVDDAIQRAHQKSQELTRRQRRVCPIPPAPVEADVIGKVCHLAQVADLDVARVLSWHMYGDMDCVVTKTLAAANKVNQISRGQQQVLPIENMHRRSVPDWDKQLPHVKYRPKYEPPGNPVYARHCLTFPAHEEECRLVFSQILGDTILMDTQEEANQYRKEVVKFNLCPTILTRSGERIRSNGKFGGSQNRAPPAEKMKNMFGEPIPTDVDDAQNLYDLLKSYKQALIAHQKTQDDIDSQIQEDKTPEIREKRDQLKKCESELAKVEKELGLTSDSLMNHSSSMDESGATPQSKSRKSASNTSVSSATGRRSVTPSIDTPPAKKSRR